MIIAGHYSKKSSIRPKIIANHSIRIPVPIRLTVDRHNFFFCFTHNPLINIRKLCGKQKQKKCNMKRPQKRFYTLKKLRNIDACKTNAHNDMAKEH